MLMKGYLRGNGLTLSYIARCAGISRAAMRAIVRHDIWPKRTTRADVMARVRMCFPHMGDEAYDRLWSVINDDDKRAIFLLDEKKEEAVMISGIAKKKFNIGRDPFVDDVQRSGDVYVSKEHAYIRQSMWQTARYGGFLAIIGESGSGKSTLRRDLLARIAEDAVPVAVIQPRTIDKRRLTAQSICEAILADVAPALKPKRSLEAKARQIEKVLVHSSRTGQKHTLIIEEAHDLSVQTLKYLKRFWELEDGFTKLLSIILIGQPEMRFQMDEGRNYDAREVIRRIETAQLLPLDTPGQIEGYLSLKFKRVGLDWSAIAADDVGSALREKLTRQTVNGQAYSLAYPLIINNMVKRALNVAAELGATKLDSGIIGSL